MLKQILIFNALFLSVLAYFIVPKENTEMTMCNTVVSYEGSSKNNFKNAITIDVPFETDTTKSYAMPNLCTTSKGDQMLTWTEKDKNGMVSFCLSFSKDGAKTFGDKKVIYSGKGIGNSRLMRAKVLTKKNGTLVAIFSNRVETAAKKRVADIVYCESKDNGNTWTAPKSVDSDQSPDLMRGFFDAVVLKNDEIAVAYLKDVKGSTKHEERDLRMVITKDGIFQPEKLLDAVVCDCCNINLLVDKNGNLNVYYRDNNDDIRDIARLISKDNGLTFGNSEIVSVDNWKIAGCPHSGAVSVTTNQGPLVAWYSGSDENTGIRLVDNQGKKLLTINDKSAKNANLATNGTMSTIFWDQASDGKPEILYKDLKGGNLSETYKIAENAMNASGIILNSNLLVAYESKNANNRNGIKITNTVIK